MYDKIKNHLDSVYGVGVDPRVVQEITSYFQDNLEVGADENLSDALLSEAETIYAYLACNRAIFGGTR